MDRELARGLEAAGIDLPCRKDQEHTPACHLYGFQSFRYAHTRLRFGRVSDRDLQEQIGEASFAATGRHVKQAETHQRRTYEACLPKSLKVKAG